MVTQHRRAEAFIISEAPGQLSRDNGVLAAGRQYEAGTVLMDDGSGRLIMHDGGDGPAAGILLHWSDSTSGVLPVAILARQAEVNSGELDFTANSEDNTEAALAALGIRTSPQLSAGSGGGGDYAPSWVVFDGSTWLNLPSFSGSDSPYITVSGGFVIPEPATVVFPFDWDAPNTEWLTVYFNPDGSIEAQIENIVGGVSIGILIEHHAPAGSFVFGPEEHTLVMSIDTSPGAGKIWQFYLDDEVPGTTSQVGSDPYTLPFHGYSVAVPEDPVDTPPLTGKASNIQTWVGQFIDLSDVTNRRKFVTAENTLVDPAIAAGALGAPTFRFTGNAASWTSQAAAQGFTLTGTLTDA